MLGHGFNLHHVGYAVLSIDPMTALYVELYGYVVMTPVIHDPTQTALVQFLRLEKDSTYLEFVAPDSEASKLKNAVRNSILLNHLCYSVTDIERATARLRERGMFVLSMPVAATAFGGRRVSWLMGRDRLPIELVERGQAGEL